jgi:hypothetical protein
MNNPEINSRNARLSVTEGAALAGVAVGPFLEAIGRGSVRSVRVGPRRAVQTTAAWVIEWKRRC